GGRSCHERAKNRNDVGGLSESRRSIDIAVLAEVVGGELVKDGTARNLCTELNAQPISTCDGVGLRPLGQLRQGLICCLTVSYLLRVLAGIAPLRSPPATQRD